MTPQQQMEQLSFAYIRAVATQAGYSVIDNIYPDLYSRDGLISANWGNRPQIDFQAKATTQDIVRPNILAFRLDIDDYNDLRRRDKVPHILIVLHMPKDSGDWLNQTDDELCLRRCAYWMCLAGMPASSNKRTVTVHIPISQVFNGSQLDSLMDKADRGEDL